MALLSYTGPVAQWIRHLATNQGIPGSSPGRVAFYFHVFFLFVPLAESLQPFSIPNRMFWQLKFAFTMRREVYISSTFIEKLKKIRYNFSLNSAHII